MLPRVPPSWPGFAAVVLAGLVGCPDAVPGAAAAGPAADPDAGDAVFSSSEGGASSTEGGGVGAPLPRTAEPLASVSGNLALGAATVYVATKGAVVVVPKVGGDPATILSGTARWLGVTPSALFAARTASNVTVAGLDGSAPRELSNGQLVSSAAGLVADDGRLYWLSGSSGNVYMTDTTASDAVTLLRDGDDSVAPVTQVAAAPDALILAIQGCGGCASPESLNFTLVRRPPTAPANETTIAEVKKVAGIVADGRTVFVIERGLGLRAFSLDGSSARPAITGPAELFDKGALALDDAHVYWLSRARGQVLRASRDDGEPVVFAEGLTLPNEDAGYSGNLTRDGGAFRIAVDATHVYVSDETRVVRFAK